VLDELKHTWNTIENCGWELRSARGTHNAEELDAIGELSRKSLEEFEMALENDLNSSLALKAFLEFVTRINKMALSNGISKEVAAVAGSTYHKIMDLLGLRLIEISDEEVQEVTDMISKRDQLRAELKYRESDEIRATLFEKYSVELMDRAGGSFWKKIEKRSF
ncbi:MAG: DALR domain-containing protein, partial [Nitrososphaeraceae archaeon]